MGQSWIKLKGLLPALILVDLFLGTMGEFRFCHHGPHKFQNKECPYGLYLPRPLHSSCVYYANDQTGPSGEAELTTCGKVPGDSLNSGGERIEDAVFQGLFLDIQDPNEAGELGQLDRRDCEEECLKQYRPDQDDENLGATEDPEDVVYDEMLDPLSVDTIEIQKNLTAGMFLDLLEDDAEPELGYLRSAQLLRQSMKIMTTVCAPYLPPEFFDQVYKGFLFLVLKSKETVEDVGMREYKEIEEALRRCERKLDLRIEGVICNDYPKIIGYVGQNGTVNKYRKEAKTYRWGKYDPFVEGAWSAFDFVHGYCPPVHRPNFNYHYIYEAGLEPLFTKTIMQRWPNPPKLKRGNGYWNNLLGVKDAPLMMRNLDACLQVGYSGSIYKERLNRPYSKFPKLMGRHPATTGDQPQQQAPVGWIDGLDQYWAQYKQNDGFAKFLESSGGMCIKTEDDLNSVQAQLAKACTLKT